MSELTYEEREALRDAIDFTAPKVRNLPMCSLLKSARAKLLGGTPLRGVREIPPRGTGGQDRSKPPRPEPSTLSPAEALSLIVACLSGDHRKAGQGCGEDECWLCCAEATAKDALAAFPAAPVGEGSRQEVDLG